MHPRSILSLLSGSSKCWQLMQSVQDEELSKNLVNFFVGTFCDSHWNTEIMVGSVLTASPISNLVSLHKLTQTIFQWVTHMVLGLGLWSFPHFTLPNTHTTAMNERIHIDGETPVFQQSHLATSNQICLRILCSRNSPHVGSLPKASGGSVDLILWKCACHWVDFWRGLGHPTSTAGSVGCPEN